MAIQVKQQGERGIRRVVWVSKNLDEIAEKTRKEIGMARSGFYRYALTRLLEELGALQVKRERKDVCVPAVAMEAQTS